MNENNFLMFSVVLFMTARLTETHVSSSLTSHQVSEKLVSISNSIIPPKLS